ncbi:DUF695 domain-containing protein [Algibacillus agarilyticus]|uniref:DUF695 domain-containing protein n=1 Tax=Algibacillus agarilyticus TaxID=2234133 RepID=UPI000DCFBAC9|nr:DUF695 domain-containing protein [Algibacillus agarilyticus]
MSASTTDSLYFTAHGEQDEYPVIFTSMKKAPIGLKESDYPHLVNINWPFSLENNGMPDQETKAAQIAFEKAIAAMGETTTCHLMLVITGNGRKEWFWYVFSVDLWMGQLNECLAGQEAYPIEITISKEPDWATYYDFLADVQGI